MNLEQQLKEIPIKPGIYMFYDETDTVLYVGKAINLKNRVRSYFNDKHTDRPWIRVMIGLIKRIETTIVANELEALMLESTLIKQYLPKFNIKLTDDKAYPYIKLSRNEPIPRFSIVRRRSDKTDDYYFGPYLSARSAQFTLEFLRDLYGIHISDKPIATNKSRACFHCQLTGHSCPSAGEISAIAYGEKIDRVTQFLRGKRKYLLKDLEIEMEKAADQQHFERATKLRNRLHAGQQIITKQGVITSSFEDYDAIGISTVAENVSISLLHIREGRVTGQQNFFFQSVAQEQLSKLLRDFLSTMYPTLHTIPKIVTIAEPIEDQPLIEQLLTQHSGHVVELRIAERGDKNKMVNLATRNAESKLQQRLITTDKVFEGLIALQELLLLPVQPERIEAIDISNLGSSEPVGACVCYINGQPDKNEYRRYIIKTVEGQNDFAMIREVVARRLSDSSRPLPQILLIDGGPEQLKFAMKSFVAAGSPNIKMLSLAKKPDRIFLPERKKPLPAKRGHKGVLMLARIRDEVHRFGITFQRSRQRKKSLKHTEIS